MSTSRAQSAATVAKGEALFEEYLQRAGLQSSRERTYQRPHGATKWPDFAIQVDSTTVYCELKDLHARSQRPIGTTAFDPYGHIRKSMDKAREQFQGYEDHCCVLVLRNVDDWEFRDRPHFIFGAMLGDEGIQIPFNARSQALDLPRARSAFLRRGKMIHPHQRTPRNTSVSAIAVVSQFDVPNPEFAAEFERRVSELPSGLGKSERIERRLGIRYRLYESMDVTLGSVTRVSLFENPFAAVQVPKALFAEACDARYRFNPIKKTIERIYAGRGLVEAERLKSRDADLLTRIEQLSRAVVKYFSPERIVLFGSHATGVARPDSDVDLLVVFPGQGDATHRSLEIRNRCNPDFALDLITCSAGELAQRLESGSTFYREIIENGRTLHP